MLQFPPPMPFTNVSGKKVDNKNSTFNTVAPVRYSEGKNNHQMLKNTQSHFA
jgi:hypothetical protein